MKQFLKSIKSAVAWVWKHTSAGVAVVLILTALVIGYRIGSPPVDHAPVTTPAEHEQETGASEPQMYTCSMHPSVRLPDPDAKCPICFMDLIPVSDDNDDGEGSELRISMSENAVAMSRIETTPVGRFFPTAEVRLYGKVTYDETLVARLTAYFPGRIERLFVNYVGVSVARGDHMAHVYSPELLAAFEELRQSSEAAGRSGGSSELIKSTTRDTLDASREKLRLYGLSSEQIRVIEDGTYDSDDLVVYAPIGGVVTALEVRVGDYVQTGTKIATIADLSRLWIDMEAYESQLPLLQWGQRVTFTVESHPGETFEGRISFIEPIVDDMTRTAAVRISVENPNQRLKPGMFASAVVRTRVAADGAVFNTELAGRWVCPMHPSVARDAPGDCGVCDMQLVTAESLGVVGDPEDAQEPLVVPGTAVLFTGTRSVVYVEVPDTERPTYEGRQVVLGPRAGDLYIVREGLTEGERVVVNGTFRVDSAMQIAAKPSMMTPGGGGGGSAHAGHGGTPGEAMPGMPARVSVPDSFVFALKPVYAAYLDAQEALAGDDLSGFAQATADLKTALGFVEEAGLVGNPLAEWRRAASRLRVDEVITTLDIARVRFDRMSQGVIALQRLFGHHGTEEWVLANCPMAFDNAGANWLQRGTEINNPYYGEQMLGCGDIRESFAPLELDTGSAAHKGHSNE